MIRKTFRLFVSSTFNDFINERIILNNSICEKVDAYCQNRGYNFQMIDLRWGINGESALNQQTLEICLEEVKRCKDLSPKPNFLLMVGERYGWVPLPYRIARDEFEQILSCCTSSEQKNILEWYELDENKVCEEYYLLPRTGDYINDLEWEEKENELKTILIRCAQVLEFNDEKIFKYTASATEQEILEGLFGNDNSNNVVAVFRKRFSEKDADKTKVDDLKKRIFARMNEDGTLNNLYDFEFDDEYYRKFEEKVLESLLHNIDTEINRIEELKIKSAANEEKLQLSDALFFGREKELAEMNKYIINDCQHTLYIGGESGTGKTTLLKTFVSGLKEEQKDCFSLFYGEDENSYLLLEIIKKLCINIVKKYGIKKEILINNNNITEVLYDTMRLIPNDKECVIVIDGLDMFDDINSINENVFPHILPQNIKLIVSSASNEIITRFSSNDDMKLTLTILNHNEAESLVRAKLSAKKICIKNKAQNNLIKNVLKDGGTPLQVTLLADYCSKWHSKDEINDMPRTEEDIVVSYINKMFLSYGHYQKLVYYALAFISIAPYGITEEELQILLFKISDIKEQFDKDDRYGYKLEKLPFVMWSRLFYDLKESLTLTFIKGRIVVKFVHNIFYRAFIKNYGKYCEEAKQILIDYYMELEDYADKIHRTPNFKKTYGVIPMLLQTKSYNNMCDLLLKDSFIDAMIKADNLEEILSAMYIMIELIDDSALKRKLSDKKNILYDNFAELKVYRDNYLYLIHMTKPYIDVKDYNVINKEYIRFDFDTKASLRWQKNGVNYAVFCGAYAYVFDRNTNLMQTKIYVEQNDELTTRIKDLVWLNDDRLAVVTTDHKITIYSLKDGIPNVLYQLSLNKENGRVLYSDKHDILFYIKETGIITHNVASNSILYEIKVSNSNKTIFNIDYKQEKLFVSDGSVNIFVYDITTGKKVSHTVIKNNLEEFQGIDRCVWETENGKWLITGSLFSTGISLYDPESKSRLFIHPPLLEDVINYIVGKNTVIFQYANRLILVDVNRNFLMKLYFLNDIREIAWVKENEEISVLSGEGIYIINLNEFILLENENCFLSEINVMQSLKYVTKILSRTSRMFKYLFLYRMRNEFDYENLTHINLEIDNFGRSMHDLYTNIKGATLLEFAYDGHMAVAYEAENAIKVFNPSKEEILLIKDLGLALDNSILEMKFSSDSKYLLIMKSQTVIVIDIKKRTSIINVTFPSCAPNKVNFSDEEKLIIGFENGSIYNIDLRNINKRKLRAIRREVVNDTKAENYTFPFYLNFKRENVSTSLVDYNKMNYNPDAMYAIDWFKDARIYDSQTEHYVLFKNGQFYLDGQDAKIFKNPYCDFFTSVQDEKRLNNIGLFAFLHEKNDITSRIIEYNDGKYFLLVSKMLNSIVLFDVSNMIVMQAKKIRGNIIGIKETKSSLFVYVDRAPYVVELKVEV